VTHLFVYAEVLRHKPVTGHTITASLLNPPLPHTFLPLPRRPNKVLSLPTFTGRRAPYLQEMTHFTRGLQHCLVVLHPQRPRYFAWKPSARVSQILLPSCLSHDCSCCVSRPILAPPPLWQQKHTRAHDFAHSPDLWHQPRLANVTCAWGWGLRGINSVYTFCYALPQNEATYENSQHSLYSNESSSMKEKK
jgi:hypothetical protein